MPGYSLPSHLVEGKLMRSERVGGAVFEHWTPEEVRDAIERDEIHLVDVREPQEYMLEKIGGAEFLPMSRFSPQDLPAEDGKPVVLYCATGNRTRHAAAMVLADGAGKIAHLEGGITAWKRAGLPTE
jgi:rhodanese-related sulfurtransferase